MKKQISVLLAFLFLLTCGIGSAAPKKKYSIPTKQGSVLQSQADRGISFQTGPFRHEPIPGESATTGMPWQGNYMPMLVQISNAAGSLTVKGRTVKSSGIGNSAPWGIHHADIVYESVLYQTTGTRLTCLFSDSLPQKGVGPVRSARVGSLLLREEWQGGLVFSGGSRHTGSWQELLAQTGAREGHEYFMLLSAGYTDLKYRVRGVRAPDNFNADIAGFQKLSMGSHVAEPRPFLFADESPYGDYTPATLIHLDWGQNTSISHFQYREDTNTYLRYCGAGMKQNAWAPFAAYAEVDDRSKENMQQMTFANVIIQRTEYKPEDNSQILSVVQAIGKGNADIFIGGRYIPGYWVREGVAEPTVFYDDKGNELQLVRGKTYIAHFPPEDLCVFTAD